LLQSLSLPGQSIQCLGILNRQIHVLFSTNPNTPHLTVSIIRNCMILLYCIIVLYYCIIHCILLYYWTFYSIVLYMYRPTYWAIFSNSAVQLQVCYNKVELSWVEKRHRNYRHLQCLVYSDHWWFYNVSLTTWLVSLSMRVVSVLLLIVLQWIKSINVLVLGSARLSVRSSLCRSVNAVCWRVSPGLPSYAGPRGWVTPVSAASSQLHLDRVCCIETAVCCPSVVCRSPSVMVAILCVSY